MKKFIITSIAAALFAVTVNAQTALKKVYNEDINPLEQIDQAVAKAKGEGYSKEKVLRFFKNWTPKAL